MEFLKALEEAKQLGVSKDDFVKIWEMETKLNQQREEVRALELKSELAKFQEGCDQNNLKSQKKLISQLKESMQQQNKAQLEEILKMLENQVTVAAVVVKNELLDLLNQFVSTMKSELLQTLADMPKSAQPASASNAFQRPEYLQQEQPRLDQLSDHGPISNNSEQNYLEFFPSEVGAMFHVQNLENFAASKQVIQSPDYVLPDFPIIVYLAVWFNKTGNLTVEVSMSGETGEALKTCRIFTVNGSIKNKNSGSFSDLFEGDSQPLRRPKQDKEMKVKTTVCLTTGSGSYDDVTFDELDRRGFVFNDSCIIKWFVTSEEFQGNTNNG